MISLSHLILVRIFRQVNRVPAYLFLWAFHDLEAVAGALHQRVVIHLFKHKHEVSFCTEIAHKFVVSEISFTKEYRLLCSPHLVALDRASH